MGNAPDQTVDKGFMMQTEKLMESFGNGQVLFHVQDIKFPLSTDQMKIVDATGRRVKLAGGNWSGGHMCRHCVDGLECRPMKDIAMDIRFKFKMNCIRLTYSLQLIYDNNIVPDKYLKANPELIGKTSMQIFDITVKTLTDVGLMVILNNHTSTSQWCCSNDDGDGLWWSRQYPEYLFFQHVDEFAKRYKNNPRVIGMDMRNQIRKANGLQPSWGDGNPLTDWRRAAEKSAQIALQSAPHWLILIGGINYQLDLTGVKEKPIKLSIPNKLVYTGHFYGFSWPIPSWSLYTYENFKKKLFNSQTYVRTLGYPFLLGEYGSNTQDIPWKYLMRYLEQTNIDWTYWALDGFKCDPQKDETYGVFTNDFKDARHPEMLEDMINVGPPKKALQNYFSYHPDKVQYQQSVIHIDQPSYSTQSYAQDEKLSSTNERPTLLKATRGLVNQRQQPIPQMQNQKNETEEQLSEKKRRYFEQLALYSNKPQDQPQQSYQQMNSPVNSQLNYGQQNNQNQYNQQGSQTYGQGNIQNPQYNYSYNQNPNQNQNAGNFNPNFNPNNNVTFITGPQNNNQPGFISPNQQNNYKPK